MDGHQYVVEPVHHIFAREPYMAGFPFETKPFQRRGSEINRDSKLKSDLEQVFS